MGNRETQVVSLQDEIDRKTYQTLSELYDLHQLAQISQGEFKVALDAVWGIASGLMSDNKEFAEFVAKIGEEIGKKNPTTETRLYLNDKNKGCVVSWGVGSERVAIIEVEARGEKKLHEAKDDVGAKRIFEALLKKLNDTGYRYTA